MDNESCKILALKIYELQNNNECIYNTKLVNLLTGILTHKEISHSLNKLMDEGRIKSEWRRTKKGSYYYSIFLTSLTFDNISFYLHNKPKTESYAGRTFEEIEVINLSDIK